MVCDDDKSTDPICRTPFGKALRWRVHNSDEAFNLAASHRSKAAEARREIPADTSDFYAWSRARGLEQRARHYDELAETCERHAARLDNKSEARRAPKPPIPFPPNAQAASTDRV